MGAGIAQVAAVAGHTVQLLDNRPGAAADAIRSIQAQISKLADKGKLSPERAAQASANLVAVQQLSDLAGASLVIEAIVENLQAKQGLYAELEGIVGDDCIFVSAKAKENVDELRDVLYKRVRQLHVQKYPYNDFLYEVE